MPDVTQPDVTQPGSCRPARGEALLPGHLTLLAHPFRKPPGHAGVCSVTGLLVAQRDLERAAPQCWESWLWEPQTHFVRYRQTWSYM